MFPESDDFTSHFPGHRDGVIDLGDLLFLAVSARDLAVIDASRFDGVDHLQQKHAVLDGLVFEVFDSVFFFDSFIGPSYQLLLIDLSYSFFPVHLAELPYNSKGETDAAVDDIDASDSNQDGFELLFADLYDVVAVLDDEDAAVDFVGDLFPVDGVGFEVVDDF